MDERRSDQRLTLSINMRSRARVAGTEPSYRIVRLPHALIAGTTLYNTAHPNVIYCDIYHILCHHSTLSRWINLHPIRPNVDQVSSCQGTYTDNSHHHSQLPPHTSLPAETIRSRALPFLSQWKSGNRKGKISPSTNLLRTRRLVRFMSP